LVIQGKKVMAFKNAVGRKNIFTWKLLAAFAGRIIFID